MLVLHYADLSHFNASAILQARAAFGNFCGFIKVVGFDDRIAAKGFFDLRVRPVSDHIVWL